MSRFRNITTALAAVLLTAPAFAYDIQTPGNDTKLSVYGFVYAETIYTTTGAALAQPTMDLYHTYSTSAAWGPLDASQHDKGIFTMGIQASRFGVSSVTPTSAFGDITTKLEWDMNGVAAGNGLNFRHMYATVGNWLFGRTWSTFDDLDAGVDCVDWQGQVGNIGYDTPRRPQIRYTFMIDKNSKLNPAGTGDSLPAGTSGDTKIPALAAAYNYSDSWGHINVGVLSVYHGVYVPATAGVGDTSYSKSSFAARLSGDVKFGKDDLVFSIYDGSALGAWGPGIQVSQFTNTAAIPKDIQFYSNLGVTAGYTHVFSDQWRGNLWASGVKWASNDKIPGTQDVGAPSNGYGVGTGAAIKQIYQGGINAFYTFNKNTQMGLEYMYETGKTFGAQSILQQDGTKSDTAKNGRIEFVLQAKF